MIPPRANPSLLGQAAAEDTLRIAAQSNRLHHAWLLSGPTGIGKATLAFRFARWLLAGASGNTLTVPDSAPVFRRVAAGTHADLLTVERRWDDKRRRLRGEIVVDDVRPVADFLRLTPAEGGWRVVVVDGPEHLNRNAVNALLKLLEEPPPRSVLLLPCAAPGRLPATFRSRCRKLAMSALNETDMLEVLTFALPDLEPRQRGRLVAMADGAPGRAVALALAAADGVVLSGIVEEFLTSLPRIDALGVQSIADRVGRLEGGFATFLELLRGAIVRALRRELAGEADPDERRLAALRPLDAWSEVWHGLMRLQDEAERLNLDKRQAIISGLALLDGP